MLDKLFDPSWFSVTLLFLFVFLVMVLWSKHYEDESDKQDGVFKSKEEPIPFEPSPDFIQWWTPGDLYLYANMDDETEKMATPVGHHLVETIDNLITPIIEQWEANKQARCASDSA